MQNTTILSFKGGQRWEKIMADILVPWKRSRHLLAGDRGSSPLQEGSEQKAPQEIPCQLETVAWTVGRKSLLDDTECSQK